MLKCQDLVLSVLCIVRVFHVFSPGLHHSRLHDDDEYHSMFCCMIFGVSSAQCAQVPSRGAHVFNCRKSHHAKRCRRSNQEMSCHVLDRLNERNLGTLFCLDSKLQTCPQITKNFFNVANETSLVCLAQNKRTRRCSLVLSPSFLHLPIVIIE
jgi:hypothetical protein